MKRRSRGAVWIVALVFATASSAGDPDIQTLSGLLAEPNLFRRWLIHSALTARMKRKGGKKSWPRRPSVGVDSWKI